MRRSPKSRDFYQFVEITSDLTFIEDPNKDFVFCTCEKGMSGKVTFFLQYCVHRLAFEMHCEMPGVARMISRVIRGRGRLGKNPMQ